MADEAVPAVTRFQRFWSVFLLASILGVAGILSALTAMRFAIRGREVAVPDLVGKSETEARELLSASGLQFKVSGKRFAPKVPEGRIMEQVPQRGSALKANRTVRVLVSLGERRYPVPNLVGNSLRAAQLTLSQRQFTLGNAVYAHTDDGEPATVVYQSPAAGASSVMEPYVHVLLSLGPLRDQFVMPDLIGQPLEIVRGKVGEEGFRLGKVSVRRYPGLDSGLIIQQSPPAGARVSRGDRIDLEVSQ